MKPFMPLSYIRIILSSNKIKSEKQNFANYFVKNLNNKRSTKFFFLDFLSFLKKYGKDTLLFSQSNCSYSYVLMITAFNIKYKEYK